MIPIKSERELRVMRESCEVAATVLDRLCAVVREGISTLDVDLAAKEFMKELGCRSACYHYGYDGLKYPGYVCISVNDEVIHGIGSKDRILKKGDVVSMDVSVFYKGFVGDNTKTVVVGGEGSSDPEVLRLIKATGEALADGILAAKDGGRVGDISHAIQSRIDGYGYGIVREFTGHGVGRKMHEDPQICNYGKPGTGAKLKTGMTLAIEPMINMGTSEIYVKEDGWTVCTADGKPSCHIEHTVLVTPYGGEILTIPRK